jgi:hypothetical protein
MTWQSRETPGALRSTSARRAGCPFTGTFTALQIGYAGFYNSSGAASDFVTFDNFSAASVPEPPTQVALVTGVSTMCLLRRSLTQKRSLSDHIEIALGDRDPPSNP